MSGILVGTRQMYSGGAPYSRYCRRMKRFWVGVGALLALGVGSGCNPVAISKCHDEMKASQEEMLKIDTENLAEVESALVAVNRAHAACVAAERDDEVSQIADAQKKLMRQVEGLRELQDRPKTPPLTEEALAKLAKTGDPDCPRGQQYEHHQNKQMIRCTGPQLVEMNWLQAKGHFERRGFSSIERGLIYVWSGVRRCMIISTRFRTQRLDPSASPLCLIREFPGRKW